MAVCSANYKFDSESISCFCESSKETLGCASSNLGGSFASDLVHQFTESLHIEDGEDLVYKEDSNTLEEDGSEDMPDTDTGSTELEKCLIKSSEFPCSAMSTPSAELVHGKEEQEADPKSTDLPYSRSISLPTASKLVSAIKGSREKQGKPPKKLSVTWAPDVYDPIPTAVSHVPKQRHRNDHRKNGKNKQKGNGKSSRGSKGKDKKQGRKHGGSTKRSYHPLEDNHIMTCSSFHSLEDDVTAHSSGPQAGAMDSFCGSSFLKKSVTKLHFPVAKAS